MGSLIRPKNGMKGQVFKCPLFCFLSLNKNKSPISKLPNVAQNSTSQGESLGLSGRGNDTRSLRVTLMSTSKHVH